MGDETAGVIHRLRYDPTRLHRRRRLHCLTPEVGRRPTDPRRFSPYRFEPRRGEVFPAKWSHRQTATPLVPRWPVKIPNK
jgi:hypothetical protein